jgi:small acid-soluble spore protein F (minor alpha/beta-type SASP)
LKEEEKLKYEIARELGLYEKVKELGWKSLSAKETGRIGGIITKKRKLMNANKSQQI